MRTRKRIGSDVEPKNKRTPKPRKKLGAIGTCGKRVKADQAALAAIVDGARDALWSWTPDGTIVRWNAEAQRLFGYSAKEIVGQSLLLLVPLDRQQRARETIKKAARGQWYGQYETVRIRKDGSKVDVELTVSPIVDDHGKVVECLSSCRDISERKHIQSVLAGRVNELTTLIRFTEKLRAAETFEDIYIAAFEAIHDALGCERAAVLLFDSANVMRFVAWRGLSDEYRQAVDGHSPWTPETKHPEVICINDIDLADQSDTLKTVIKAEGIRALAFIPLLSKGNLIGKFMTYYREPRMFAAEETTLANTIAQQLAIAVDRQVAQEEQAEVRERVAADLSAMTRLRELGSLCAREGHYQSKCLSAVVETAIAITGAPRGSLQLVDARSGVLTIAAQRGFSESFLNYFARVSQNAPVTAAAAMRAKQRIIVEDVTKSEIFYDQPTVKVLLDAGVWAVQATPLIDADGKVFGVITTHFSAPHRPQDRELRFIDLLARQTGDYLSRIQAEQALRSLQSSLRAEVKSRTRERDRVWSFSEDLLGVSDFEGYFLSVNPAWQKTLGWSEDEIIKVLHVNDLCHPDDAAHSWAGREQLAHGVPTVRIENRFRHKDGSWRWIAWTMTAEQGLIYVAGRHVTAEKEAAAALERAQQQLANAQKMEALGQLTGGVAHDFNNIMMIVSGYAQSLKGRMTEPKHVRALQAIEAAVSRGENLTRQLLSFSRHQPLNPAVLHPAEAVGAIQDVLSGSTTGKIELSVDIPNDCWPIRVDKSEFALALVNIALNARDAMPSGGRLSIKCENKSFHASDGPHELSGDFVAFEIKDTGCGIPAGVLPKVFDPFFTTKEVEKGTGLGLSQVYGFASRSGGSVAIQSELQRGTTVRFYLPRSQVPVPFEGSQEAPKPKGRREEIILVVEDNADVRRVAVTLLKELGYRTLEADSATSALSKLDGTHVDLVFSDIVLPGSTDGVSLAEEIAVRHPRISILLTTGYARRVDAELKHPVLRKPYDIRTLDVALREAIETHKLMIEEDRVLRTQISAMLSGEARIRR